MTCAPRRATGPSAAARGLTLIELIISIGITGVVIALTTAAFAETVRTRGALDRYLERAGAAEWLLRKVADDVRRARAIEDGSASDTLRLATASGTITWRATDGRVERADSAADRAPVTVCRTPGLRVTFQREDARAVIATVEWDESPRVGISHPILSRRAVRRCP